MSGTSDPAAAQLAEIREFRAQLIGPYVLAESYAEDVDALLAAYDALAEAVLAWDKLEWPHQSVAKAEAAQQMLALARKGMKQDERR